MATGGIRNMKDLIVGIKGAGEMATGIAWRLYQSNIRKIFMMEVEAPLAVRRKVCFCDAVYTEKRIVEGVTAVRSNSEINSYRKFHVKMGKTIK